MRLRLGHLPRPGRAPGAGGLGATISHLAPTARRLLTYSMFVCGDRTSPEPFAEGLVESGSALGIDEFLLVQWVAPLASESPEFLVALLFVWRGTAPPGCAPWSPPRSTSGRC